MRGEDVENNIEVIAFDAHKRKQANESKTSAAYKYSQLIDFLYFYAKSPDCRAGRDTKKGLHLVALCDNLLKFPRRAFKTSASTYKKKTPSFKM